MVTHTKQSVLISTLPKPTRQAVDGGGLARPIGTQQTEELVWFDAKPGALDGPERLGLPWQSFGLLPQRVAAEEPEQPSCVEYL